MEKSDFWSSRQFFLPKSPSRRPRSTNTRSILMMSSDSDSEAESDSDTRNSSFSPKRSFGQKLWQWNLRHGALARSSATAHNGRHPCVYRKCAIVGFSARANIFIDGAQRSAPFECQLPHSKVFQSVAPCHGCSWLQSNVFLLLRQVARVFKDADCVRQVCWPLVLIVVSRLPDVCTAACPKIFNIAAMRSVLHDFFGSMSMLNLGSFNELSLIKFDIQPAAEPLFVPHYSVVARNPPTSFFALGVHALLVGAASP